MARAIAGLPGACPGPARGLAAQKKFPVAQDERAEERRGAFRERAVPINAARFVTVDE